MYMYILRERAKRASASETYIFRTLNTSAYIIIQSMHFPLLMVWRYKRYYTDKTLKLRNKIMNMRASGASELRKFSHAKIAISFNILLVFQILCLRKIFPLSLVWYYNKRQYTDKALTLRKCICAIERSERA